MKKPELLSPAGDWMSLRAAVSSGADAVYFGVKGFNMRQNTNNFEIEEIKTITRYCRKFKVKAYLALNIIFYDNEIQKAYRILKEAKLAKLDAVIAWDFAILNECERLKLPIHLSTQASISNIESLDAITSKFRQIKRVVLARELTLDNIKDIITNTKLEVETFIHGAMCVSISGRCFLSQFTFNKSANRGDCLQPCRRAYIVKDPEEGHEYELSNDYIMSPKDLCAMPFIEKLIEAGIHSFKIEGRNRSPEYVAVTTACYREVIDAYFELFEDSNAKIHQPEGAKASEVTDKYNDKPSLKKYTNLKTKLLKKLKTVYNRDFSDGFYLGKPINEWADSYGSKATTKKVYIGKVKNFYKKPMAAEIRLETGNLKLKDNIMIQGNTTGIIEQKLGSIQINNKSIKQGKKGQTIAIKTKELARIGDKVYLITAP